MTKKDELPHISKRIVALREARGLSQKDLGALAGVTAPAITMWETGKRFPRGKNLKNLARALGVSESAIVDDSIPISAVSAQAPDRAARILAVQARINALSDKQLTDLEDVLEQIESQGTVIFDLEEKDAKSK